MILTRNHIGQVFNNDTDGSWGYVLIDIKGKDLLFYSLSNGVFVIDTNKYKDWRRFKCDYRSWPMKHIGEGWETAKRAEAV